MHEISIVRNIFSTLEDEFPDRLLQITRVQVKAGILSNVQPILMQNAFEAVQKDEPKYAGIMLEVQILPILIQCAACDKIIEINNYKFICSCGEPSKNIIQGEELMISQVEFAE
jgi:hydrogenase nickel incorporation protein HypA/HybF